MDLAGKRAVSPTRHQGCGPVRDGSGIASESMWRSDSRHGSYPD